MKTAKTTQVLAGFVGLALLVGCGQGDVSLPGQRFDARTPLAQTEEDVAPAVSQTKAVAIQLPAAQSGDWAQTGGNARHSAPHGVLSASPSLIWSVKIGAGNTRGHRISASPVVLGGMVYAMDPGSRVTAVATATGAVLWQSSIQPEFDSSVVSGGGLAASAGKVFVTTGYGEVIALDASTGAVLWRQRLSAPMVGAPMVEGQAVYAVGRDGSAVALNTATGRILWQNDGADKLSGMIGAGTPAGDGSLIYLPFGSGQILAVSPTGETVWQGAVAGKRLGRAYAGFGDVTGDPVLQGGVLYAGSSAGRMVALDAQTGKQIWSATEGAMNAPLVLGGSVFAVNDAARLVRLNAQTGELIWGQQMPYFKANKPKRFKAITAHYGPVLAGGHLIVASGDGSLRLFDPASGQITAQADISGGAASAPVLAGGMLFVMGGNGQLHAFR